MCPLYHDVLPLVMAVQSPSPSAYGTLFLVPFDLFSFNLFAQVVDLIPNGHPFCRRRQGHLPRCMHQTHFHNNRFSVVTLQCASFFILSSRLLDRW